jgi:hypothetical protein
LMQHYQDWSCLPPSCFSDKTGLKTSEDAACQIPDIITARRNFQGGGNKNKHLFYPNVTLLLLFLLPIFTVPNPTSVLNSVPYIMSPKPHYLRNHKSDKHETAVLCNPSLVTDTPDDPQHFNTSFSPHWHIMILRTTDSRTHFSAIISRKFI